MKHQLKPRADLDDGDPPAFVTTPDRKVPICCRCGRKVPSSKSLWTLCEYCINADLEIVEAPPRHPQGTHALIVDLAREMALQFPDGNGNHAPLPPAAVLHHEARLMARGVDQSAARRLATAMATDPAHRVGCAVCQAGSEEIRTRLEDPQAEVERLARVGREHLPRRRGGGG